MLGSPGPLRGSHSGRAATAWCRDAQRQSFSPAQPLTCSRPAPVAPGLAPAEPSSLTCRRSSGPRPARMAAAALPARSRFLRPQEGVAFGRCGIVVPSRRLSFNPICLVSEYEGGPYLALACAYSFIYPFKYEVPVTLTCPCVCSTGTTPKIITQCFLLGRIKPFIYSSKSHFC